MKNLIFVALIGLSLVACEKEEIKVDIKSKIATSIDSVKVTIDSTTKVNNIQPSTVKEVSNLSETLSTDVPEGWNSPVDPGGNVTTPASDKGAGWIDSDPGSNISTPKSDAGEGWVNSDPGGNI